MKNYKIAVAGTGYVGLSLGVLLSQHHQVVAVDIVQAKVDMINNKKSPIQDDYIEKYLAEKELNLTATLDAKAAFYIFVSGVVFMFTVLGPLFAEYISRSSYFFIPLQMIGLSNTYTCYSKKSKNIWAWILIAILFATWYRAYVLLNYAATVPYQFYWD